MSDIKVKLYNWQGEVIGDEKVDTKFFGVKINPVVVQQVVIAQRANSRETLAHTKGRSEVRGGGRKPWKQKGTGRARHGSIRSPLWVGGGITFGPTTDRNFSQKINKKTKAAAFKMVMADKLTSDRLIVVDSYDMKDAKTKTLQDALKKLPVTGKSVLIVTASAKDNVNLAAKNLKKIETIFVGSLNVVDLLKYHYLVVNKAMLTKIQEHYRK
ncbi:MAG: large subunit ribosomal protein [Patescibacteria group bacterium]|jgi:large subunit ribosomal protein L4|nr:large subunit ribosomal protein [Patescibacteria group bacterium]